MLTPPDVKSRDLGTQQREPFNNKLVCLFRPFGGLRSPSPSFRDNFSQKGVYLNIVHFDDFGLRSPLPSFRDNFSQKGVYLNIVHSEDFGLRSPPPVIQRQSSKKRYTLISFISTILGVKEPPPSFRVNFSQKKVYLNTSIVARVVHSDHFGLREPPPSLGIDPISELNWHVSANFTSNSPRYTKARV